MSKLIESVHTLVIDGDMPAKAIASAIGKTLLDSAQGVQPLWQRRKTQRRDAHGNPQSHREHPAS